MTRPSPSGPTALPPAAVRPLRILVVAKGYGSFDLPGRGSFVADQAASLAAAGHRVTVVAWETVVGGVPDAASRAAASLWYRSIGDRATATQGHRWGAPLPMAWLPGIAATDAAGRPDLAATAAAEAAALRHALDRLPGAPFDAIHAHSGLTAGVAAWQAAKEVGLPVLVTEHMSSLRDSLRDPAALALYRRLLEPGCRLVAVSAVLARQLEGRLGLESGAIGVIPDVVDVDAFPAAAGTRVAGQLLWIGARTVGKGTDVLLGALADLRRDQPHVRLRLIGAASSPGEEARYIQLAADLGVRDAVSLEPPVDRAGVAAAMATADVFVHPSPYETFGVVAAEAVASGLPVAATPSGGVEGTLGTDGRLGEIAAAHTPAALADAVRTVLARRSAFDPVAMHADIAARFAPDVVAAALDAALRDLGAGRAAAGSPDDSKADRLDGDGRPANALESAATGPDGSADAAAGLFDHPLVVVATRREIAARRIGMLPVELARGITAVTLAGVGADLAKLPGGPTWVEIDPERGFREARARLGGAMATGSAPRRAARLVRHPIRTLRRRSLYRHRAELRDHALGAGIRDAIIAAGRGGPVTVVPVDLADLLAVMPLLADGGAARLAPTTLRGLAQAWDAAGGPALEAPARVAGGAYDPAAYWGSLHSRHDLSAVGQSGLPPEINAWLYRSLARSLRGFLHRHRVDRPAPASAFDIGVGTGYWVRFWHALGVETVDGCDLVPDAVASVQAEVQAAGRKGTYAVADIGVEGALPGGSYGAVSCMNVLLHVTDDAAFERALAAIAGLVAPGGVLVLAEPMLSRELWERRYEPTMQSRARPVARYRDPLEAAGLVLEDVRAGTALANNPIEAGSAAAYRRYARWWRWVARELKTNPGSTRWLGPLVMALDRIALRAGAAPSTKLALFRRPADDRTSAARDPRP